MGIMMPETCWESIDNKHLTVASCWFSLSLHNLLHDARSQKPKTLRSYYLAEPRMTSSDKRHRSLWSSPWELHLTAYSCTQLPSNRCYFTHKPKQQHLNLSYIFLQGQIATQKLMMCKSPSTESPNKGSDTNKHGPLLMTPGSLQRLPRRNSANNKDVVLE